MRNRKKFEFIINRFGRPASVVTAQGDALPSRRCVIQALRYKNKMYMEGTPTEIGINDAGYYLFLAPADFEIDKAEGGGYISDGEKRYHIDRREALYSGDDKLYIWAILKEERDGGYPVYNHFRRRGDE